MMLIADIIVVLTPLAIILILFEFVSVKGRTHPDCEADILCIFFPLFCFFSLGLFEFVVCFGA